MSHQLVSSSFLRLHVVALETLQVVLVKLLFRLCVELFGQSGQEITAFDWKVIDWASRCGKEGVDKCTLVVSDVGL